MKKKATNALLLSFIAVVAASLSFQFKTSPVRAQDEETTSMPKGWGVKTLDDAGENPVVSPYLSCSAYKDSAKGNSLKLSRRVSSYQLYAMSSYFQASANTSYKVEFSYRTECLDDDENVLVVTILEKLSDGSILSGEVAREKGRQSVWAEASGYYTTSENCESLMVEVSALGYGDFYVADMTLKGRPSPLTSLMNFALIEGDENASFYSELKANALTDDCYSGERALTLSNQGLKMKLGFLPVGTYELKFKYKHAAEAGSRGSVRLDNVSMSGTRLWYGDAVSSNGTNGSWAEYTYKFQKSESVSCDIQWFQLYFYGTYTIDDLGIYDSNGYNYVPDGSFEGYDLPDITLQGNVGLAMNSDGSLNYAGCYTTFLKNAASKITFSASAFNVKDGEAYTLSYSTRNGHGSGFGGVTYGETTLVSSVSITEDWQTQTATFTAAEGASMTFSLGDGWGERVGYLKDISIKDSEGKECLISNPKIHVTDDSQIGDNVFPYGQFDYTFPSEDSSSSYSEDSYSQESRSETSSSPSSQSSTASSESKSSSSSSSSSEDASSSSSGFSDSLSKAMLGVGIGLTALATGGLIASVIMLVKGKKHE